MSDDRVLDMRCGVIYRIRHTGSDHLYIGSAMQPIKRQEEHFRRLREGRHHTPHLQHAFDKYGREAFIFEIVEWVEDHLFLTAREQFWMWRHAGRLYNRSPTAGSNAGIIFSAATRAKQALRMLGNSCRTGKPHPIEDRKKISAGLRRAISEGRKLKGAPALKRFQAQILAGEAVSPWVKQARNDEMVDLRNNGFSYAEIGRMYSLENSGARKTILSHIRRMETKNVSG